MEIFSSDISSNERKVTVNMVQWGKCVVEKNDFQKMMENGSWDVCSRTPGWWPYSSSLCDNMDLMTWSLYRGTGCFYLFPYIEMPSCVYSFNGRVHKSRK